MPGSFNCATVYLCDFFYVLKIYRIILYIENRLFVYRLINTIYSFYIIDEYNILCYHCYEHFADHKLRSFYSDWIQDLNFNSRIAWIRIIQRH